MKEMLKVHFNIENAEIEKVTGGFAAEAYVVSTNGAKYFLKAYNKLRAATKRNIQMIDVYTKVLIRLSKNELKGCVPVPVLTVSGDYSCENDSYVFLLYEYLQAKTIAEDEKTVSEVAKLGEIIRKIHTINVEELSLPKNIYEDFELWCLKSLTEFVNSNEVGEVHSYINKHLPCIKKLCALTQEYKQKAKNENAMFVLCHTDVHNWNLMRAENQLILIDWEGIKVAPKEADLFAFEDLEHREEFELEYKKYNKNYKVNATVLKFYNLRRLCEDIWEYIEQILHENLDKEELEEAIESLIYECSVAEYEVKNT